MKILLLGSGGREHALTVSISKSSKIEKIYCIPGNAGTSEIATNKREIKTVVMVEDNQTIVLGGLIGDDVQESERKVPILGDIPLLGRLFKSTSTSRSKKNLVIFLKPTIIRTYADMQDIANSKFRLLKAEQILRTKKGRPSPDLTVLENLIYPEANKENTNEE